MEEIESTFNELRQRSLHSLQRAFGELTTDERGFALWLIESDSKRSRLLKEHFPNRYVKAFFEIQLRKLKNFLGIKQQGLGVRDLSRAWNDTFQAYDNEYYRYLKETSQLKNESFGSISTQRRVVIECLLIQFHSEMSITLIGAHQTGRKTSKRHHEEKTELLKKWLADPEGLPPNP